MDPVPKLEHTILSPQTAISLSLFFAIAAGVSTISYQMGKSEAGEIERAEIKQEIMFDLYKALKKAAYTEDYLDTLIRVLNEQYNFDNTGNISLESLREQLEKTI